MVNQTNQEMQHRLDDLIKSCAKTFMDYMSNYENFFKNFSLLLNNLPSNQQKLLLLQFSRAIYINQSQFYSLSDYTDDERKEMRLIRQDFNNIKQHEDYFKYKDFLLPVNIVETSVFYYHLGIEYIFNQDKLRNKDFIDAGAFIGDSALILNKLAPGKIYAFEPVSVIFNALLRTISLNKVNDTVIPVKLGLGSVIGEEEIVVDGPRSSVVNANFSSELTKEKIQITTIDEYVKANNLEIGLIKMDTEGLELDILRGAESTIKSQKPTLIIGIYHNAEQFFEVKPLLESWNLGYKFHFVKLNPFSLLFETTLICETL